MIDFDKLSKTQVDALCNVAFGGDGMGLSRATLRSLERRGLIEPTEQHLSAGRFGVLKVQTWGMPVHVHIAFCEWCAQLPEEE